MSSPWVKHGILNVMEHGLTRVADGLTSLLLLWVLSPELFSKIAIAQAIAAPLILFFIAPETALYRDYPRWQAGGASEVAARLRALRLFAWGKVQLAILLSAGIAFLGADPALRFWAMIWAFMLILGPQTSGPDREYLRLNLQLTELNWISVYQKSSLLVGVVAVSILFKGRISALAAVAAFSTCTTPWIARAVVLKRLRAEGASEAAIAGQTGPSVIETLKDAIVGYSLWNHLNGVVIGWVQTMDLFFLGVFRFPARAVGLYAAVLKLANFAIALPLSLSNTFAVWIGRRIEDEDPAHERAKLWRVSLALLAVVALQGVALYLLSPWIFRFLSHGRWSDAEREIMVGWLKWILAGSSLFAAAWPVVSWLSVRSSIRRLSMSFYLPWGVISIAIYVGAILSRGLIGAAVANVFVSCVYLGLLARAFSAQARGIENRPRSSA